VRLQLLQLRGMIGLHTLRGLLAIVMSG
jgi:hypothetical protein